MSPEDLQNKIKAIIVDELGCDEIEVTPNANIVDELGADSLDVIELCMRIEEEFGIKEIPDEDMDRLHCVKDLYTYVEKRTR